MTALEIYLLNSICGFSYKRTFSIPFNVFQKFTKLWVYSNEIKTKKMKPNVMYVVWNYMTQNASKGTQKRRTEIYLKKNLIQILAQVVHGNCKIKLKNKMQ